MTSITPITAFWCIMAAVVLRALFLGEFTPVPLINFIVLIVMILIAVDFGTIKPSRVKEKDDE